ncbi:MAG: tyrosine-type recombinase/integrase [Thermoplasmatales archaeon]|nr:MAG: tyrosine-type recombinase/integrase [Thermoplasmatales archaeon]
MMLSGITKRHRKEVKRYLIHYAEYILYKPTKGKSLEYFKYLQENYSQAYFIKQMYQILKFLKFLGIAWSEEIKLPKQPNYNPPRIDLEDIRNLLKQFEGERNYPQIQAFILITCTSGIRAMEGYKLQMSNISLENRTIKLRAGQTKTRTARVTFFNEGAQNALRQYLHEFETNQRSNTLFAETTIRRTFRNSQLKPKHLRKFFSQIWTRRNGNEAVKHLLMGHSQRSNVDQMHYNYQSEEDLKQIYDRVMGDLAIIHGENKPQTITKTV